MDRSITFIIVAAVVVAIAAAVVLLSPPEGTEPPGGPSAGLANPAAVYCTEMGYGYEIRTDAAGNQYGVCILPDGTERDEWEVYREAHPAGAVPPVATQTGTGGMITLGEKESGGVFDFETGRGFAIRLDENPTTGYRWALSVPEGIVQDSEGFEPPAEGLVGAGGVRTWTLHGETPGTYEITAEYRRPWETTGEPAMNFSVTIEVV
ncbi:MAG: protease inhibitor I42 family protein [Methanomicrobiaceae archaeon]|nr:protease inhibitor I42 family protein [Methanomicrobiaceae archaeon]